MNILAAFLRLVRFPNLFFIALTQVLFYYCIILPRQIPSFHSTTESLLFVLLVVSSMLIAAGGYVINDYFDLNIDKVNKPGRMVVEKVIRRRWAIIWHWLFSTVGVVIGFYISFVTRNWLIGLSNFVCVLLLWFYSTTFKRQALVGNIIISLLTAWTVLVVFFFVYNFPLDLLPGVSAKGPYDAAGLKQILRLAFLYAGFAFIISLARELVKDMEDVEGDARYGCKTMPIVWGIPVTKMFTGVWLVVLTGAAAVIQFYAVYLRWWWSVAYGLLFLLIPLLWVLRDLYRAGTVPDFHRLSTLIKLLMLSGILSMVFFRVYS